MPGAGDGAPDLTPDGIVTVQDDAALESMDRLQELCRATGAPVTASPVWWRAAALSEPRARPLLVLVQRGGASVAAAPLRTRTTAGVTTVELVTGDRADHGRLPALDAAAREQLAGGISSVLDGHRRWHLHLRQLPPGDPVVLELARLRPLRVSPGVGCPQSAFDPDQPLVPQLKHNSRKALRRCRNRLDHEGRVLTTEWLTGADAVRALPELQALHRRRDHASGRWSDLDDPAGRAFHEHVVTALAREDRVVVQRTRLDGRLASYNLLLRDDGVLRVWDGRIDPDVERYSIGWLAAVSLLERAHADGLAVDWMRGEQQVKTRAETSRVHAVDVEGWSSLALERTAAAAARVSTPLFALGRRVVPPARRGVLRAVTRRR